MLFDFNVIWYMIVKLLLNVYLWQMWDDWYDDAK